MFRAYLRDDVEVGPGTILPARTMVYVDTDKNPNGDRAQIKLPSHHVEHPGAWTIVPKKYIVLDIESRISEAFIAGVLKLYIKKKKGGKCSVY